MSKRTNLGVAVLLMLSMFIAGPLRASDDEDIKGNAMASLAAAFLLQTYFNVGFIADASAAKDANKEQLEATLGMVENLLNSTGKQLDEVGKTQLKDDEKAALKKIKVCYALLDEQISALHTFWKDKSPKNAEAFDHAREAAWKKISDTLNIK